MFCYCYNEALKHGRANSRHWFQDMNPDYCNKDHWWIQSTNVLVECCALMLLLQITARCLIMSCMIAARLQDAKRSSKTLIFQVLVCPYEFGDSWPENIPMILLAVLVSSAYFKTFDVEHHLCFRYLYAILFGCSVTIVEVASKTSLVGQLVPEKHQAGRWPKVAGCIGISQFYLQQDTNFCWGKELALKHFTLSPIIMEVENYPNLMVTTIGGTHFPLPWLWEEG